MNKIITGSNIVKSYDTGTEQAKALNGVNVEIENAEFVAVMGPSGSGKSTLLSVLSGMDVITSGSVKFCDTELSELRENELADVRRKRMGFIFQQPTMLKNLNIMDNIILPVVGDGKKNIARLTQKAEELMKKTGIDGLANRDITEVSGGQLQRAGICRALMNAPEILFADEPTGSLNSKATGEIMGLLVNISRAGTTILLVTHDAKVAAHADRVLFTDDGNIISEMRLQKFNEGELEARTEKVMEQMTAAGI